jgi:LysR family transcriptional regulator, glycine cleavage system transcriptional activator
MHMPSDRLPSLDLLVSFEAAARHLSFTRAAAERFVTQSAMSRQIQSLEHGLGVPLFRRGHRSLSLTAEGLKLHSACVVMMEQLRKAMVELRPANRREVLSVTATPGAAALWLIPRLPSFTRDHPGVDVRLDASFELRDLVADDFDLAIRYSSANAGQGRRMFPETMLPVCSPKLLRDGPPLKTPEDLRHHTLLQIINDPGMPVEWDPWFKSVGLSDLQPSSTLSFSLYSEAIAAALAGQGVAIGRRPLVDALLKAGKLKAPFKGAAATMRAYFVVVNPASRARPAVQALEAWLLAQARVPA